MRILILGGHGFIGGNLADYLSTRRAGEIFVRSRRDGLDLSRYESVVQNFSAIAPDVIVNCAAHVGGVHYVSGVAADVFHDNVVMGVNLYRAVKQACPSAHVINPLSNCCYPGDQTHFEEKNWLSGDVHASVYPYGHAKRLLYAASVCYRKQYGVRTTNVLVPNAFGPGDRDDPNKVHALNGMIIRMLQAWRSGAEEFEIWGTGRPVREWIYVDDVSRVLALVMQSDAVEVNPLNVAQKRGYSIAESARRVARLIGFRGALKFNPAFADGAPEKIMDDKTFRRVFPQFQFTDHSTGINRTIDYYKSRLFGNAAVAVLSSAEGRANDLASG